MNILIALLVAYIRLLDNDGEAIRGDFEIVERYKLRNPRWELWEALEFDDSVHLQAKGVNVRGV